MSLSRLLSRFRLLCGIVNKGERKVLGVLYELDTNSNYKYFSFKLSFCLHLQLSLVQNVCSIRS